MGIEWSEELATGITLIDDQHRELYANVARLHAVMKERRLGELPDILHFLQGYALEHFATEVAAMESARYPGLADHTAAHDAFVGEFLRHRDRLTAAPTAGHVMDLSAWLGLWLRDHVRRVDGEMARFLRGPAGRRGRHGPAGGVGAS
jgi:hemerythrin-like metal-binding protein